MTLLLSSAIVFVVAFLSFRLGQWEHRRHTALLEADRLQRIAMNERYAEHNAELQRITAQIEADTAEMAREMGFYAEASEVVNCKTWGNS